MPRRWVTIRAMSTAELPMRSIELITWSTDGRRLGLFGWRAASTDTGPHLVHEDRHALLEAIDLLGHVLVTGVEGGVGEVDHELGEVLASPRAWPRRFRGLASTAARRIRRRCSTPST